MDDDTRTKSADVIQRLRNYNATLVRIGGFDVSDPVIKDATELLTELTFPLTNNWSHGYTVEDEENPPLELTLAKSRGAVFQVTSVAGWINIEGDGVPPRFRYICTYRYRKAQ